MFTSLYDCLFNCLHGNKNVLVFLIIISHVSHIEVTKKKIRGRFSVKSNMKTLYNIHFPSNNC